MSATSIWLRFRRRRQPRSSGPTAGGEWCRHDRHASAPPPRPGPALRPARAGEERGRQQHRGRDGGQHDQARLERRGGALAEPAEVHGPDHGDADRVAHVLHRRERARGGAREARPHVGQRQPDQRGDQQAHPGAHRRQAGGQRGDRRVAAVAGDHQRAAGRCRRRGSPRRSAPPGGGLRSASDGATSDVAMYAAARMVNTSPARDRVQAAAVLEVERQDQEERGGGAPEHRLRRHAPRRTRGTAAARGAAGGRRRGRPAGAAGPRTPRAGRPRRASDAHVQAGQPCARPSMSGTSTAARPAVSRAVPVRSRPVRPGARDSGTSRAAARAASPTGTLIRKQLRHPRPATSHSTRTPPRAGRSPRRRPSRGRRRRSPSPGRRPVKATPMIASTCGVSSAAAAPCARRAATSVPASGASPQSAEVTVKSAMPSR